MAQASTSRLGICQTCNTTPARYSCPACSFPSCSLPCSTSHKTAQNCTGIAPPVWSRPIQANEMSWGSLMRDQSYIAGVGRAIEEVGKQLVDEKLIPQGRRLGADETVRLDERSDKEDKMVREARNQGVELMLLPKGMSKRQKNLTRWDPKKRELDWMVEVAFHSRPSTDRTAPLVAPTIVATTPIPSNKTLQTALLDAFNLRDKKGKGKAVDPEEATWRLAQREWVESFKAGALEPEETVGEIEQEKEGAMQEVTTENQTPEELEQENETTTVEGEIVEEAEQVEEPRHDDEEATLTTTEEAHVEPANDPEPKVTWSPVRPPARSAPPVDDDSPFVLLLAFHSRPVYPDSTPTDGTQPSPAPTSTSTKPPGRSVYQLQLTAGLTLREALAGSTLLENPCFEIWPRETFLRQKLLGKLKIVEQPAELRVRERTGTWERGRGRGRGMGGRGGFNSSDRGNHRGGGSGGGGRGRGRGGSFEGRRDDYNRSQDSGWAKRGNGEDRQGDAKRVRND